MRLILLALFVMLSLAAKPLVEFPVSRILYVGSDGYTPEAEALAPLMNATEGFFAFGGDGTFTDAHPTECAQWPMLQYLCSPVILTDAQVEYGWQTMRWPLLQRDRAISYGNHDMGGRVKPDPFVAAQFGNQPFYTSRVITVPGPGSPKALLVFLNDTVSTAAGSPQRIWLESVFASNPTADWKLVFVHGAPYSAVKPSLALRALTPLFDAHQVDLIISGHVLWYERTHQYVAQTQNLPGCQDGICTVYSSPTGQYLKGVGRINVNAGCGGMRCFGTATNPMPTRKTWQPYHAVHVGVRHHYATIEWSADGNLLTFRALDAAGVLDMFTVLR